MFLENHINAIKSKNKHKDNTSNISTMKHFLENHINAIKSKNKHKDNTSNISTMKHFLENHINAIKSKNKHKDNVKSRLQIVASKTLPQWLMNVNSYINLQILQTGAYASEELVTIMNHLASMVMHLFKV